ncbi:hypothetical protein [Brevibacillus porteri]|uniref:hypothetical protein n=1 Tax=Brevibacillus porteri TaxID=2126350 RepID=UPI003D1F4A39
MKKRQRDKILKIVARQINSGDFTKLNPVHYRCIRKTFSDYIDTKYINEFRPWWYDQFDNWGTMKLSDEHKKFYDKSIQELQEWTGIDMERYRQYVQLNHNNEPKRQRKRKERKEKEQPIRKLRNPREYKIRVNKGNGPIWETIIAEPAFQYQGYEFFIAHYENRWVVSDRVTGARIIQDVRYKRAVKHAKERIEKYFEKYVAMVERFRQEESA